VVEYESVIENTHLHIRKTKVATGFLRQFFPIANSIIRNVPNCTTSKAELVVLVGVVFEEFFYYLQWVACCFCGCFMCFAVGYLGFSSGYLYGCFWVKSYEGVLGKFFWSFD
jgi:hypothetical protein